jgi:hypothetical protein
LKQKFGFGAENIFIKSWALTPEKPSRYATITLLPAKPTTLP